MKAWLRVHKYSSLVATLFMLLLCVTGLPLVFSDELAGSDSTSKAAATAGPARTLDELVALAPAGAAQRFVQFVFWQDDAPGLVGLGVADVPDAPLDDVSRLLVDATTGQPRGVREQPRYLEVLLEVHKNLYLGQAGDLLLAVMALSFLASTASGIVIYGPFMRRLDFGTVRTRSRRLRWLDLHNLVGIATAVWALVVGATGLMNTLEGPLFSAWQSEHLPALLASAAKPGEKAERGSIALAVASARRALPAMQPTSIGLAGTRYGTPRHHLVWMHGATTLTQRLFTPVLVESSTGNVVLAEPLPWYLRLLEVSRPLHFGDYGGLPLKLVWAGLDLLLIGILVSGMYLWWAKWRTLPSLASEPDAFPVDAEEAG